MDEPAEQDAAPSLPPPTRREKLAWCLFDFANSSFVTVVVTVVFSRSFAIRIVGPEGHLGLSGETWWSAGLIISQVLVLLSAPVIGAMADRAAAKKRYLFRSYLACVVSTAALTFCGPGAVLPALLLFIAANVAFSTGENLISGFLPELAPPEEMGRLSGYGWALGYFGGLGALALALPLAKEAPELTNLTTAGFFALAGLPTFLLLRERARPSAELKRKGLIQLAFGELRTTLQQRSRYRDLFVFLGAVMLFQAGIVVVIAFSSIYAEKEIGMDDQEIILLFIYLQVAAALGAFAFGFFQDWVGSRPALMVSILLWIVTIVLAGTAQTKLQFTAAGVLAGISMGPTQSASRALVGMLCPEGREAEWFGLWGLATKSAAVLGPLYFAVVREFSDLRTAVLGSVAFFAAGLLVLSSVNVARGRQAAGRTWPLPGSEADRG